MIAPIFFLDKISGEKVLIIKNTFEKKNFKTTKNVEKADIVITYNENSFYENKTSIIIGDNKLFIKDKSTNLQIEGEFENILDTVLIHAIATNIKCRPFDFLDFTEKTTNKISKFLQALVVTMEVEDKETKMSHSQRVAYYSEEFAKYLNWDKKNIKKVKELAMLHDIGRIGIEQLMLFTPTRINDFETWDLEHTVTGSIFLSSLDELWWAVPVIRSHHENWNGSGYPDGLSGEEIPYLARFIGIVDWFDIATHTASSEFEGMMTVDEAINYIDKKSGIVFDPVLSKDFLEFIKNHLKNNKFI
jgi:HD-GYP domain-containing protein (c-di-GMP phosphodiesterase class II)